MIEIGAATQQALSDRAVTFRDFIWFIVRDRDTGVPFEVGYWSDFGTVDAEVINPRTGTIQTRTFSGAGSLISIGAIPRVSNLTVQNVSVELSQIADVNSVLRQYEAKQAGVEIYRGVFAKGTLVQLEPAFPRFVGVVDDMEVSTPEEGGDGRIALSLASSTQELTRRNPATRSQAHQIRRNSSDTFRQHSSVVGTWELKWGTENT